MPPTRSKPLAKPTVPGKPVQVFKTPSRAEEVAAEDHELETDEEMAEQASTLRV